ncbi:Cupredoxin [Hygrophoropsis aurantiaca]|uniref:Cupredoxin n=1 Tax=Hygrophoropsis aurantiaca TaxID=72124 RepID=A0ACB8AKF8_9AGAM|nr:Cupredoxin [Hygrophoropsis aurantiaca]
MSTQGIGVVHQDDSDSDHVSNPKRWSISSHVRAGLTVLAVIVIFSGLLTAGFWLGKSSSPILTVSCPDCDVPFNYNAFYGIPNNLSVISPNDLVNATELELKTGFIPSSTPQLREYTFNITQALAAPDGFQKPMILVNNQFPGPLIEANTGDTIRVHVNNFMSNWSTTIHWHGIDQKNTTWMDGVAAVSQCGIPPGQSFTYEFTLVDQRGTFWYHSHLSVQYTDGLFGPLIIHDPSEMIEKVDEERIVFMGDWYHTYGSVLVASYLNPASVWVNGESGVEPVADNLLMNGRNIYNCSVTSTTFPPDHDNQTPPTCDESQGGQYTTTVEQGKAYRLRLINHSTFFSFWFSIDNHTLEIVEIDGVEVAPIPFRGVNVNIGQRYSVIVRANQTVGNYYMRATFPTSCFLPFVPYNSSGLDSTDYQVMGVLNYQGADPGASPIGTRGNTSNPFGVEDNPYSSLVYEGCNDMPFDMPVPLRTIPAYDVSSGLNMHYLEYEFRQSQNVNRIFVNRTSWAPLENNASLWKTIGQDFSGSGGGYNSWSYSLNQQVLLLSDAGRDKGVQVVLNSLDAMEHPWHLHGHEFQIVGWGEGMYGQGSATTWNLDNPMRRDTVTVPASSHVILRFLADNPGMWAFHCHVAWHMEGGMFVQFLERPNDLMNMVQTQMDPDLKTQSMQFCYKSADQSFGTQAQWEPEDLIPSDSATVARRSAGSLPSTKVVVRRGHTMRVPVATPSL